jgi:iron(III) transport system substrate-binding protein
VYDPLRVKAADVATYEQLADPKLKGLVCTRSGSHPYNLSLFSTVVERLGDAKGEAWLKGVVANMARAPKGGDTDQIKAVAAGECGVTISNTYYLARMMRSTKPDDQAAMNAVGIVWPNQATWGTHVNVSGAGVLKHAPNKANAVKFMEYLASNEAQAYFANGNNEWPVVKGSVAANPTLVAMGTFKPDALPIGELAKTPGAAQTVFARAGGKCGPAAGPPWRAATARSLRADRQPAVGHDHLAGDITRLLRGQEQDHVGDVIGLAHPAQRHPAGRLFHALRAQRMLFGQQLRGAHIAG